MKNMLAPAKDFLKVPFNRYLIISLAMLGIIVLSLGEPATGHVESNITSKFSFHFFFMPTCPHCSEQKLFNEKLMDEFPEVKFVYHDVSRPEEQQLLLKMAKEQNLDTSSLGVPATFFLNHSFIGFDSEEKMGARIRSALEACINECQENASYVSDETPNIIEMPIFGKIDVSKFSLLSLSAMIGFADGFNPCAMWVLVYLIAIIIEINDKKRAWFIVGTFLIASGIIYFILLSFWLNSFLLIGSSRIVNIIIGLFALGAGILSIKEYFETKGALVCKVVNEEGKKKTMGRIQEIVSSPLTIYTILGTIFLAFAVNSVEFFCSFFLPLAFTKVLALHSLPLLEYYGYILVYVFFFMLDDMIIFSFAVFAIFSDFGQKYAKYCKAIAGIIMVALGILLLFAPNLLS